MQDRNAVIVRWYAGIAIGDCRGLVASGCTATRCMWHDAVQSQWHGACNPHRSAPHVSLGIQLFVHSQIKCVISHCARNLSAQVGTARATRQGWEVKEMMQCHSTELGKWNYQLHAFLLHIHVLYPTPSNCMCIHLYMYCIINGNASSSHRGRRSWGNRESHTAVGRNGGAAGLLRSDGGQ
jgi:hypothetical protein